MTKRKQNLVLFSAANEDFNVTSSRLVRLYMNRFTIDKDDETEVTEVYNIKIETREEYLECFRKSLIAKRKSKTPNTDTHYIIANSTFVRGGFLFTLNDFNPWHPLASLGFSLNRVLLSLPDSLLFKLFQLIENEQNRSDNCYALTVLHGSKSFKLFSQNNQKMAYQYQIKQDKYKPENFWWKIANNFVTERFERSINDDLECFQQRILEYGIGQTNHANEFLETFHYQMLDDNQVENLTNSIDEYNNNLSFFKRFNTDYSRENANLNENYTRVDCIRLTMYSNYGPTKSLFFFIIKGFLISVILELLFSNYVSGVKFGEMLLILMMFSLPFFMVIIIVFLWLLLL